MGFRSGGYATVWEVTPRSDTMTSVRLSTSRKDKTTGEYETDFSGFVAFVGTAAAKKAAKLKEKDRIKLGDVDVTTKYDKVKKITYTNYTAFSFEDANPPDNQRNAGSVSDGDTSFLNIDEGIDEDELPY